MSDAVHLFTNKQCDFEVRLAIRLNANNLSLFQRTSDVIYCEGVLLRAVRTPPGAIRMPSRTRIYAGPSQYHQQLQVLVSLLLDVCWS